MGGGPAPPSGSPAAATSPPDEGSQVHNSRHDEQPHGYTVLVTGMGPFPDGEGGRYEEEDNTSHLVTRHLPGSLPAARYYLAPDDAGRTPGDMTGDEGRDLWAGAPVGLAAGVDVPRVAGDAARAVNSPGGRGGGGEVSIVPHFEAGPYLCGFIYYESLATCRERKLGTKVVFCHVPGWKDGPSLQRGAEAICAVIGAVCKQIGSR